MMETQSRALDPLMLFDESKINRQLEQKKKGHNFQRWLDRMSFKRNKIMGIFHVKRETEYFKYSQTSI